MSISKLRQKYIEKEKGKNAQTQTPAEANKLINAEQSKSKHVCVYIWPSRLSTVQERPRYRQKLRIRSGARIGARHDGCKRKKNKDEIGSSGISYLFGGGWSAIPRYRNRER